MVLAIFMMNVKGVGNMDLDLDNRLYVLHHSNLSDDLRKKLVEADKLFLRDRNSESQVIILEIERECIARGITMYNPIL